MPPHRNRTCRFQPYPISLNGAPFHAHDTQAARRAQTYTVRITSLERLLRVQQRKSRHLETELQQCVAINDVSVRTRLTAETRAEDLSRSLGIAVQENRLLQEISARLQFDNENVVTNLKAKSKRLEFMAESALMARVEAEVRALEEARNCRDAIRQQELFQQEVNRVQASQAEVLGRLESELERLTNSRMSLEAALAASEVKVGEEHQIRMCITQEKQALELMTVNLRAERDASAQRELETQFQVMAAARLIRDLEARGRALEQLYHLQHVQLQQYQSFFTQRQNEMPDRGASKDVPMEDEASTKGPTSAFPHPHPPPSPPPSPPPVAFAPPRAPNTRSDWFVLYENRWTAFQTENHCNLSFAHVPWPAFRFVARLDDLKESDIRLFMAAKYRGKGCQWRDELKRWHTDRFARVAMRIHPKARKDVLEGFNRCIRVVTCIKGESR